MHGRARVAAGSVARDAGLRFAYHNHDFEFRPLDGGGDFWSRITPPGSTTSPTSAG